MVATTDPAQDTASVGTDPPANVYEQRLAHIGRFLDDGDLHSIAIVEVEGGILVRATRHGHRDPELFELADAEPETWPVGGGARRGLKRLRRDDDLFRNGYTASLTTLGKVLDLRGASAVVVTEGDRFLAVGGLFPYTADDGEAGYEPVADLLFLEDVKKLEAGELPVAVAGLHELAAPPDPVAEPGSRLADQIVSTLARARGALAGAVSRFGRRAGHAPPRAAADLTD